MDGCASRRLGIVHHLAYPSGVMPLAHVKVLPFVTEAKLLRGSLPECAATQG